MTTKPTAQFTDVLPAVFRQDEVEGINFLGRFLRAFETVFEGLQRELDAIPNLFALIPTPALAKEAEAESDTLHLDSAAGLCPGDVLHLQDADPTRIEFVEVRALPLDLSPTMLTLWGALRFAHGWRTPVRVVGPAGPAARLSLPARAGEDTLSAVEAEALGIARGDVLRLGEGERAEYVQVIDTDGALLRVVPTLKGSHEIGQPVTLMQPAPHTTPPLAFTRAVRTAPELVVQTPAWAGEMALELDAVAGLCTGDILHLRERDPDRVEFVRVERLPPEPRGLGVLRDAVHLSRPLRFDHAAGVGAGVVGNPDGATRLAERLPIGATTLRIRNADALRAASGDVLRVDEAAAAAGPTVAEYVQVLATSAQTVTVTPPLQHEHAADRPVVRLAPFGSGMAFLSWLAGWIGLALRPDRGERWNRELMRLAGRIWPWRGTRAGVGAFLRAYLRGEAEATVYDWANPLQIGLVSTVGVDTVICGGWPHWFWADLVTNERNSRLYHPAGLVEVIQAAHQALRQEKPAHTYYDLKLRAHTMQIGRDAESEVGARVGDTTLLWDAPLIEAGPR